MCLVKIRKNFDKIIKRINESLDEDKESLLVTDEREAAFMSGLSNILSLFNNYAFYDTKKRKEVNPAEDINCLSNRTPGTYKASSSKMVINRQHMPSNYEEAVEFMYQERQLYPQFPDDGFSSMRARALAAFIKAARLQPGNFTFVFCC